MKLNVCHPISRMLFSEQERFTLSQLYTVGLLIKYLPAIRAQPWNRLSHYFKLALLLTRTSSQGMNFTIRRDKKERICYFNFLDNKKKQNVMHDTNVSARDSQHISNKIV